MKIREIMETASVGATSAGGIAPVVGGLGLTSRMGGSLLSGKYTKASTPNTPKKTKRKKNVS